MRQGFFYLITPKWYYAMDQGNSTAAKSPEDFVDNAINPMFVS
jgi:hypothetical protein